VDRALERCFTVKARTAAPPRAKVAKAVPRAMASNTAPRRAVRAS